MPRKQASRSQTSVKRSSTKSKGSRAINKSPAKAAKKPTPTSKSRSRTPASNFFPNNQKMPKNLPQTPNQSLPRSLSQKATPIPTKPKENSTLLKRIMLFLRLGKTEFKNQARL